jgi:chemotaxis protein CheD
MINIATAEFGIAMPPESLSTVGIGSCVAVCLRDNMIKMGGLAHIMLPSNNEGGHKPGKYADTAINGLIELMESQGASRSRMAAKLVGGASMFASPRKLQKPSIGESNIAAVTIILKERGIPIAAQDIGGGCGRSLVFLPETGVVRVNTAGGPSKEI